MLNRLYSWYGKRTVWGVGAVILVLATAGLIVAFSGGSALEETDEQFRTVQVSRVSDISGTGALQLVGSVEAVSEVRLQSEASGRITRVNVTLGQQVRAGQTVATIENASEYASLLQAQGSYEAAVAAAASSDVGVAEAKNNAVDAYRDAYAAANSVIINSVDSLYSNPRQATPGVKIQGGTYTFFLNEERYALNAILEDFQSTANTLTPSSNLAAELSDAREIVGRVQGLIQAFLVQLPKQPVEGIFTTAEIEAFQSELTTARATLNATLAQIDSARESLNRAEISGTGSTVSAADAQVKQALGGLRAAEANYAKTIIKTSIAGTVNTVSVKTGDYVTNQSPIAVIANNNALEITAYISESERGRAAIGDTVTIEEKFEGTVSNIAPAVDPTTKKVEIKIQTTATELSNGDTVRLSIAGTEPSDTDTSTVTTDIIVPITALKVETDRIVIFTASEENVLEAHTT